MFLYTVELLVRVDKKLGIEIELDFYRRVLSSKEAESQHRICNSSGSEVIDSDSSRLNGNGSMSLLNQSHIGPKNGTPSAAPCSIPPGVRQRRRLRRFRQELEAAAVWLKRDKVTNALTNQAAFGARLLEAAGTHKNQNNRSNSSSSSSSSSRVDEKGRGRVSEPSQSVASIVSDVLKYAQISALHVRRLAEVVFG
jgi:hypothetical protein